MTDTGMTRDGNEDSFFISETEALALVADGMGGHRSGEVASSMAIEVIRDYYAKTLADLSDNIRFRLLSWPFGRRKPEHAEERRLIEATMIANHKIFNHATRHEECRGMGTTLVGAYFLEAGAYFIHVGDSRAYRFRQGKLSLLTSDHSLANEYLQMGILRPDEIDHFPYRNVITRALGLNDTVEPEVQFETLQGGDIYLFCSDGLSDPLSDQEISKIIRNNKDLDEICRTLIAAANTAGGPDNITAVLAQTLRD